MISNGRILFCAVAMNSGAVRFVEGAVGAGSDVRNAMMLDRLKNLEDLVISQQRQFQQQQDEIDQLRLTSSQLDVKAAQKHPVTAARPIRRLSEDTNTALDHIWLLLCGALVMFMQSGFAMLEAGSCRAKNVQNILLKNLTDVCVGTLGWWVCGWAFAYGGPDETGKEGPNGTVTGDGYLDGGFIGHAQFFSLGFAEANSDGVQTVNTSALSWFFQWAFCSAASTIVSGGVAERVLLPGYVCYSFLMTAFIYPVVVAWTWGYGWLADVTTAGYMDFAGSGVVHMTGGVGALVGASIAGSRDGRWVNPDAFIPHSLPLIVLGTFILWFGWYGFNCGSTLGLHDAAKGHLAAQVAMNTTIAAATGGLGVFFLQLAKIRKYDVGMLCNGILAGLVSITAPCGNVECGSAFAIGLIGALVYFGASNLVKLVKVDDPIDAFAVHGACGAWGVLAAALFDWGKGFDHVNGWSGWDCKRGEDNNCISGAWGGMFGANVLEVLMIFVWVGGLSLLMFASLRALGLLRASDDVQDSGMDEAKHSPTKAYNLETTSNKVVAMTTAPP